MFDLVPTKAAENARPKGADIFSTHHNIADTSLYERFASFRPVPVEAAVTDEIGLVENIPTKFQTLQNTATGGVLDILPFNPDSYNLQPHDRLMQEQAELLHKTDLPLDNVEVIDRVYQEGLRVHRTILFHDMTDLEFNNRTRTGQQDVSRCRLDVFNSVDKSWSFQIFSGAYRDLCRNTQVFGGEKAYHQIQKHTKNMNVGAAIVKGALGLEMWEGQKEYMQQLRQKRLTMQGFNDFLIKSEFVKKEGKVAAANADKEALAVNQRKLATLLKLFTDEVPELGETMWAGYNALTHWATHLPDAVKSGRKEKKHETRSHQVRELTSGDLWQEMAAA